MEITQVQKRNGDIKKFDIQKIVKAVNNAMREVGNGERNDAERVAELVYQELLQRAEMNPKYIPNIEEIQDVVEEALMVSGFREVAKSYIIYRQARAAERATNVFERRVALKPYEYPQLNQYVDAIRHSYWIHTEFNFIADIQDFKVNLDEVEQSAIKNAMLAISQIEVAVKSFWGDIYKKMPKAEIGAVGATFAESEVRHHDAYSHLLEILGLNNEFKNLKKNPVIMRRVQYLDNALKNAKSDDNKDYAECIMLFSLFIEHVSLFSQFLIIMAFNKHKNMLKGISNVVEATSKEEQIHGNFGIDIINIIKNENPTWFSKEHDDRVREVCLEAYESEAEIIDWIFSNGELDFLPSAVVKEFVKDRFNRSLKSIGITPVFETDDSLLLETEWFDDEIVATKHGDFFDKRSVNYNKRSKSITSDDLF
ncbi:MAG: ribonucleotide-diphosphate reductase subunit beta [Candidatus Pacebacteria bacterium]|nr:ribonucleotide-diphosphate reductase subunit beta [Candidatus Paceibacterota bacterium]